MIALLAPFVLLLASVRAVPEPDTAFVSALGNNNNDGLTPATAVRTLARAYEIVTAANGFIKLMPGVSQLKDVVSLNKGKNITITGAGETGNAADYVLACGQTGYITVANTAFTNIIGVTFDDCADAITLETPPRWQIAGNPPVDLTLTNVVFDNTDRAVLLKYETTYLTTYNCRFNNRAIGIARGYNVWTNARFFNSTFTSSGNSTVIDMNTPTDYRISGKLVLKDSVFDSKVPVNYVSAKQPCVVYIANTTFKGPASNLDGCSVLLHNVTSEIIDSVFESHTGAPALCLDNGNSTVLTSEFKGDNGNNCSSTSGSPLNFGDAIVVTNNAKLFVTATKFTRSDLTGCVCSYRTCTPIGDVPVTAPTMYAGPGGPGEVPVTAPTMYAAPTTTKYGVQARNDGSETSVENSVALGFKVSSVVVVVMMMAMLSF